MQWGSLLGLLIAFGGILGGQYIEGGHVGSLVQGSAFCIVLTGTLGAVILQSGLPSFVEAVRMASWVIVPPQSRLEEACEQIGFWSITARREGLLQLEKFVKNAPDEFYGFGLQLLADGADADSVSDAMMLKIEVEELRLKNLVKIWDAAGGYAPTVGILGAVLGLIHVMENLSDPSKLGAGIAVAFVATIYGVGMANLIFLPVANNLKKTAARRIREMEMIVDGISCIALNINPKLIDARLRSYL